MKDELLIGIDLGGTHIKAVLTNPLGEILEAASTPTLDIPGEDRSPLWKASVKRLIENFQDKYPHIQSVGISAPGIANPDNSGILDVGTKLLGINGFRWPDYLGHKVYVLNDAHAALFAESRLGAGKNHQDLLMITLGTGVGGGIMIGGHLLQGKLGRAGHIGHISIDRSLEKDIVNTPGSLEYAIGQFSLSKRSYGKYQTTLDLVNDYLAGDTFASWVWLNSVQSLARGIVSMINVLSPELIIIGGGISNAKNAILRPLKAFLKEYEWRPKGYATPIEIAQLSNHAGAIGAAFFAREKVNSL